MANYAVFPVLAGRSWSVFKTPHFATRVQRGTTGRETRLADQASPIWEWTIAHDGVLRDSNDLRSGAGIGPGIGHNELRALMGLFSAVKAGFFPFIFWDVSDYQITLANLGTGDGVKTDYSFNRQLITNGYMEPIKSVVVDSLYISGALGWPVPIPLVYVNSVLKTLGTDYIFYNDFQSFDPAYASGVRFIPGHIPGVGVSVTSTFTYMWLTRFSDDSLEFENFMYQLWSQKGAKIRSLL